MFTDSILLNLMLFLKRNQGKEAVELNIIEQVHNLGKTSIVQNAWKIKQPLQIHGWIYDLYQSEIVNSPINFS